MKKIFIKKPNKNGIITDNDGRLFNNSILKIPDEIRKELPSLCTKKTGKK